MTRINVVPAKDLCNKHLLAEWRELPRLQSNFEASMNRKSKPFCKSEISPDYVLGKGHVKFFFDKFKWLESRHLELTNELLNRGFNLNNGAFKSNVPKDFYKDWKPDQQAIDKNIERINLRMPKNPRWSLND